MVLLLVYLFIALFTSFLCSILEAVLLSAPIPYLKSRAEQGQESAKTLLELKEDVDKPLSAILSLNTIAHTVGAAGVGAQANIVFGEAYFGIVSAVLTILILVVTEIIPKTIGANYNKELVGFASKSIKFMILLTYPLVKVSAVLTKLLARDEKVPTVSREEISTLATIGTQEGIFADKENKIIQNLIRLKHIKLAEIMTPRIVLVMAEEKMSLADFLKNKDFLHFSRIPIFAENNRDHITGYVFRELVFEKLAEDEFDLTLHDIKRDILTFSGQTNLFTAWEEMLARKEHISLILDEYGGVDGIVSLEDIIESLLGFEIIDEKDTIADMQQYALERWKNKQKKYQILKSDEPKQE
ncbi:CNNM domain-containing protein [Hugenholtzia roseola]|uniref:CNNM domain-containing protein n=1 Tax=Hugenholtzia roseola TaxID=1002 RepID=UPI0004058D4C|nr:CNNM domain-containing protein [Hugenholtzia roseola]